MYIVIFEDGEIRSIDTISNTDLQSVEDGFLSLIDVSMANNPLFFDGHDWKPVKHL